MRSSNISTNSRSRIFTSFAGRGNASGAWVASGDNIFGVMLADVVVVMPDTEADTEAATEKVGTVDKEAIGANPVAGDK